MTRLRFLLALALGAALAALGAAPAAAADGYRYWSFWESDAGTWSYAQKGPGIARPADGEVLGFRFAISEGQGDAEKPRTAPDFESICGATPPRAGTKRVALAIDFGVAADAPGGATPPKRRTECAQLRKDATASDALAATAKPLRYSADGLTCAIAGFPEKGCAEQVSGDKAAPKPKEDTGPSAGLIAGIAAVAALGAAALWQTKRRRA